MTWHRLYRVTARMSSLAPKILRTTDLENKEAKWLGLKLQHWTDDKGKERVQSLVITLDMGNCSKKDQN